MAAVATRAVAEASRSAESPAVTARRYALDQAAVVAGQLAAGLGNLAFALVAARILDPEGFARLSTFLGLYLVLSLPAASVSAAAAVAPRRSGRLARRVAGASLVLGLVLAAASPLLGPALNLPVVMVAVLGLAVPAAGPLAVFRGRLYGRRQYGRLVATLVSEPAGRLAIGCVLAAGIGATGGAIGVVAAAYGALEVARTRRSARSPRHRAGAAGTARPPTTAPTAAGWAAAAFVLLAVIQNQDLFFANGLLSPSGAGAYAALSTLGGAAAFATITIPLVLLPRVGDGQRHTLAIATGLAAALGLGAVLVVAIAPGSITAALLGDRYRSVGHMVVPYLAAMALLGVARILLVHRCSTGRPHFAVAVTVAVAAGQAAIIAAVGRSVPTIAWTTFGATATLTAVLGAEQIIPFPTLRPRSALDRLIEVLTQPVALAVIGLSALGLAVRLVIFRGIWLDEATSIHEAGLSFGGMLHDLRTTDVHPPLYFSILWVTDRVLGNGSFVMRLPSIAFGTLVIPATYAAARELWDRRTGIVAAVIASIGPILVWYSQEARMYSMFMLFAVVAIWGQARALRRGKVADWAIYALASAALGWTEYFGLFQVLAQQLVFLGAAWSRRADRTELRRLLIGWGLAAVAILALFAPLAPFAWHQFMVNQNAGKGFGTPSQVGLSAAQRISIYAVLANVAWALAGYHSATAMAALVALWPFGILLSQVMLGRNMGRAVRSLLVIGAVPLAMLVGLGMIKRNLFDIRYISGVVMVLQLLTARLVTGIFQTRRLQVVACVGLVGILGVAMVDEQINGSNPRRYDFASALHAINLRYRPGDELLYLPADLNLVIGYYSPGVRAAAIGAAPTTVPPGSRVFVLASKSLMSGAQPGQLSNAVYKLGQRDRQLEVIHKANVTVWVFQAPGTAASPPRALTGAGVAAGAAAPTPGNDVGAATRGSGGGAPATTTAGSSVRAPATGVPAGTPATRGGSGLAATTGGSGLAPAGAGRGAASGGLGPTRQGATNLP